MILCFVARSNSGITSSNGAVKPPDVITVICAAEAAVASSSRPAIPEATARGRTVMIRRSTI